MKLIKLMSVVGLAALFLPTVASAETQIRFAKGSYCGSWSGGFKGYEKVFSLGLGANQEVSIEVGDGSRLIGFRGPSGELQGYGDGYTNSFRTKRAGKHYLTVEYHPSRYADNTHRSYASVQVCAY